MGVLGVRSLKPAGIGGMRRVWHFHLSLFWSCSGRTGHGRSSTSSVPFRHVSGTRTCLSPSKVCSARLLVGSLSCRSALGLAWSPTASEASGGPSLLQALGVWVAAAFDAYRIADGQELRGSSPQTQSDHCAGGIGDGHGDPGSDAAGPDLMRWVFAIALGSACWR